LSDPPLLDIRGLTVRFGGLTALSEVSLHVDRNQVVAVIGPNGAGKTTLFNSVCGFVRPASGEIRCGGRLLRRHRPHELTGLGIARTLQHLGLFPGLTVLENVMVGAHKHARAGFLSGLLAMPGSDRDESALRQRAAAILGELGLSGCADRLPAQLPYGMQKRTALARALIAEPQLLLLDEPASGLSEADMHELADLIASLRARMSVVIVEHHMDLVMGVSDSVVVFDFGKVIARGSPDAIRDDPAVVEAYLGDEVLPEVDHAGGH
jgi:branched-chain amino acid transport system ATP-binding protein